MSVYGAPLKKATELLEKVTEERQALADDFFSKEAVIKSLSDIVKQQGQGTVYVSPAQPIPQSPGYLLYIGIGLLVLILMRKVKL